MEFTVFIFLFINIAIIVFGYFFLRRKIIRLTTNQEVLDNIKSEINQIIARLDDVTYNNIDLVETKSKKLVSLLKYVEKKSNSIENRIKELDLIIEKKESKLDNFTYSPQKIIKQTTKNAENYHDTLLRNENISVDKNIVDENIKDNSKVNTDTFVSIDSYLKDLNLTEKVDFLLDKGWNNTQIKNKLGLSSDELEFIMDLKTAKN